MKSECLCVVLGCVEAKSLPLVYAGGGEVPLRTRISGLLASFYSLSITICAESSWF